MFALILILLFVVTFLLGSVPWGVVISDVIYKKDIRSVGSGNIGTTNAMRAIGKKGGAIVFLLDFGKGILSGVLGYFAAPAIIGALNLGDVSDSALVVFNGGDTPALCAAVAFLGCIWGHDFSPWLKFKGGKGVAVAVGCEFFALGVLPTCLELVIFIVAVALSKYVSLGSILAAIACPIFALIFMHGHWVSVILLSIGALTVLWAHRGNIKRLMSGNENKIGKKKGQR